MLKFTQSNCPGVLIACAWSNQHGNGYFKIAKCSAGYWYIDYYHRCKTYSKAYHSSPVINKFKTIKSAKMACEYFHINKCWQ